MEDKYCEYWLLLYEIGACVEEGSEGLRGIISSYLFIQVKGKYASTRIWSSSFASSV